MATFGDNTAHRKLSSVCVFCGSRNGKSDIYIEEAKALGVEIAQRDITLIYGGGNVGLMGALATAVDQHGGKVVGVIPKFMTTNEVMEGSVGEQRIVESMHDRKIVLADLADAFIAAPGGYGTFDGASLMTQLGIQRKKTCLFNVAGFYDPIITMVDKTVDEGFVSDDQRQAIVHADSASGCLDVLEEAQKVHIAGIYDV